MQFKVSVSKILRLCQKHVLQAVSVLLGRSREMSEEGTNLSSYVQIIQVHVCFDQVLTSRSLYLFQKLFEPFVKRL